MEHQAPAADERTFVDRFSILVARLTMWLFAIIVCAIFYEVIVRYLFNAPTYWANELSMFMGGVGYLFAGLFTMQRREHIAITPIYDLAPPRLRRVLDLVGLACVLVFCLGITVGGYKSASRALLSWERYGTVWNPPIPAVMKPLILVVAVLIAVQAINNFVVDVLKRREA
ncbi:TRAP transporter small permease [Geminicoccaceae bacterium 1502E]|nr:TRAP transporter small permease [Geminicoccaceae bacterium 1502E]